MLKNFNPTSKSITGAAVVIGAAGLASRLVGLVRDRLFVHYFGAGAVTDAYQAAFKIPDLIFSLLVLGALTGGFIPAFTKLFYQGKDKSPAWQLANNVVNILGIVLMILGGFGMLFTPYLAKIIAPGFSNSALELTAAFMRIMLLSPLLLGVSLVMGDILQSLRKFVLFSIAPMFYNIGIIIGAVALAPIIGLTGLAWGVVLGAGLHTLLNSYGAWGVGYRWRWYFNLRDPDTRLIGKLMIPRTLGLSLTHINIVIITILASLLPEGSVTVYNYANNLQTVALGLVGIPFAVAVFPVLSALAANHSREEFVKNLAATTRQVLFLIIPCSIIFLLLRAQIVRVVYGAAKFDWAATINTADTLAFFALGLFAASLIPLFARAFYALENTKTPFVVGVISELLAIIAALVLMRTPLGVAGLALAATIGAVINCGLLGVGLRQTLGSLEEDKLLVSLYKISLAGILMALTIQGLKHVLVNAYLPIINVPLSNIIDMTRFHGVLLQGLIAGLAGLLVYAAVLRTLRLEEMLHLQSSLKKRWLRLWNVPAGIDEVEKV